MSKYRERDLVIRVIGIFAIGVAILALRQLFVEVHTLPHHEASPIELLLAAIGFLGMSFGSMLVALGHHIFDEVVIARRWGRTSSLIDQPDLWQTPSIAQPAPAKDRTGAVQADMVGSKQ